MTHETSISVLSVEEMEKLPTKRLMAYKKKLHKLHPVSYHWESTSEEKAAFDLKKLEKEKLLENVKKVLSMREHVERKVG